MEENSIKIIETKKNRRVQKRINKNKDIAKQNIGKQNNKKL